MDDLYYGTEAKKVISSSKNKGELITNCVFELWKNNVLNIHMNNSSNNYS